MAGETVEGRIAGAGTPPPQMTEALQGGVGQRISDPSVENRLASQQQDHAAIVEDMKKQFLAEKSALSAENEKKLLLVQLKGKREGSFLADTLDNEKFRSKIRDLEMEVLSGELGKESSGKVKDSDYYLGLADALIAERFEDIKELGSDGGDTLPSKTGSGQLSDHIVDTTQVLMDVHKMWRDPEQKRKLLSQGVDALTGSADSEAIVAFNKADPNMRRLACPSPNKGIKFSLPYDALRLAATPGFARDEYVSAKPKDRLGIHEDAMHQLREQSSTGTDHIANIRERTYRRDLVDPYRRPMPVWAGLGGGELVIDNDITTPVVSGVPSAARVAEGVDLTESNLTFATRQTNPHRIGSLDSISWQISRFNDQFGVVAESLAQMFLSIMQKCELDYFYGSGTGAEPHGIYNTAGVNVGTIAKDDRAKATAITNASALELADENIDDEMAAWLVSNNYWFELMYSLVFGESATARTILEGERILGARARKSTQVIKTATSATNLSGGALHAMIYGVWSRALAVKYSQVITTIDEESEAKKAETVQVMNAYDDLLVLTPAAFLKYAIDMS